VTEPPGAEQGPRIVRKYHVRFAPAIRAGRGADRKVCTRTKIQAGQIGDRAAVFGLWMSVVSQSAPRANPGTG